MIIGFHNVTPAPLVGVINFNTDIWQKDCVLEPGKKYNVVAPSGKGKTTFMHCIYGLRFDFEGEVRIGNEDTKKINHNQWADLRKQNLSIVYQDLRLFLNLTALQNIQVKSVLFENYSTDKIMAMAEWLGVSDLLHKKCETLSYGERQRVAIIRSLIQPFDWLLLDEPFSHLDKENSLKAVNLITREVTERKAGMIITSLGMDDNFNYDLELKV